ELPHFDRAKLLVRSNVVTNAINELGNVIIQNGLERAVGVCLLHKHFDVKSNEILLETNHDNTSKLAPVASSSIKDEVLPYMWKMGKDMCWSPLEFVYNTEQNKDAFGKVMQNEGFLRTVGMIMLQLKVDDILGLSLLHRDHISGAAGGTMETTNEISRELTVVPLDKTVKCDHHETVQTLWKFGTRQMDEDVCNH
ncbi:unnamed protein product, partial [Didymodactylos carnosus]